MSCQKGPYLELIVGPMFSGKTSYLIDIYNKYHKSNIKQIVINHSLDTRYSDKKMVSHDKNEIDCIFKDNLTDIDIDDEIKIILINEGQFFSNLKNWVLKQLKRNKIIYICGLDGDYKQEKFGEILDLIPICDNIVKLRSLCGLCSKNNIICDAPFTIRITNEQDQKVVGVDNYIPVCRSCINN